MNLDDLILLLLLLVMLNERGFKIFLRGAELENESSVKHNTQFNSTDCYVLRKLKLIFITGNAFVMGRFFMNAIKRSILSD